jgi:gamma-glutamylcyclotransferase (GGCT)/AIG2-like uncharacterized protein YtfP
MTIPNLPNPQWYFAYGSNMSAKRMAERGVTCDDRIPGTLYNYQLCFNKINSRKTGIGYANIIPKACSQVKGALYAISPEAIQILDGHEGFPDHYNREKIFVHNEQLGIVKAWVYIAQPAKTAEGLVPEDEYLQHLLAGQDLWNDENLFSSEIRIAAFGNPVHMDEIPLLEKLTPLPILADGVKASIYIYMSTWSERVRIDFEDHHPLAQEGYFQTKYYHMNSPGCLETGGGCFAIQHRIDNK